MTSLKARIKARLPAGNRHAANLPWREDGVTPGDPDHLAYLSAFTDHFVNTVKKLIDAQLTRDLAQRRKQVVHTVAITKPPEDTRLQPSSGMRAGKGRGRGRGNKQQQPSVPFAGLLGDSPTVKADLMRGMMAVRGLVEEHQHMEKADMLYTTDAELKVRLHADILHHLHFCARRCAVFCGRRDDIDHVRQYVMASLASESQPLVVTAPPGGGKTSFLAKVTKQVRSWLGERAVVVVRFLGTSPQSSALLPLLEGLCSHICLAYGEILLHNALSHIRAVQRYLHDLLSLVSLSHGQRRPLVIVLDSIEGLSPANRPQLLHWLPKYLPAYVKIIISMTPDIDDCLAHARAHLASGDHFLELPLQRFLATDVNDLITLYLQQYNRALTEQQTQRILSLRDKVLPLPFLFQLWLNEACLWKSYTADLRLPGTVTEAIEMIFIRLEQKFGKVLVSATLGYLSLCWNGISEIELEDALSVNDAVLNEVYRYHNPPLEGVIRIPAMIWTRMRHDLHEHLVQNQTPNRVIVSWYHKQFRQVALDRYTEGSAGEKLHADLAKVFLVADRYCSTIHLEQRKLTITDADRLVTPQHLKPANIRKLICVTHHLLGSKDVKKLKKEVVCNLAFLNCVYRGIFSKPYHAESKSHMWQMLQDIDEEAGIVVSALRLSNPLIIANIKLLPVQLLNRLIPYVPYYEHVASLCKQAKDTIRASGVKTLIPIIGSIEDDSSPVNWYFEGPTQIVSQSQDGSLLLVGYGDRNKHGPLCKIFNVPNCQVTHTISKSKTLANDILCTGVLSRNNRRAYLLCKKNYVVCTLLEESGIKIVAMSNNLNGAGSLNETMAVSTNDKMLLLAGSARLAMLEDVSDSFYQPDFKVQRVMNFSGATATTNIMFTDDATGSITSHTIPGRQRVIGALSRWTFDSQGQCKKVPLPEPIPPGCMIGLPSQGPGLTDCVLVACANGRLYTVCLSSGAVLREMLAPAGLRGTRLLLDLHAGGGLAALSSKEATSVALFDLVTPTDANAGTAGSTRQLELGHSPQALKLGPDDGHVTVLLVDGVLKVFGLGDLREEASVVAHGAGGSSLCCPDGGHVLTCGQDRNLKQFELSRLVKKHSRCSAISETQAGSMIEYSSIDNFCVIDDSTLLSGHKDSSPCAWTIASGQKLQQFEPTNVGSTHLAIVANGTQILSHDNQSMMVKKWAWPSAKAIEFLPSLRGVILMQTSHDTETVVLVCEQTSGSLIICYNPAQNEETARIIIAESIPRCAKSYLTKDAKYMVVLLEKTVTETEEAEEDGGEGGPGSCRFASGIMAVDLTKSGDQEVLWLDRPLKVMAALNADLFTLADRSGSVVIWQPPRSAGLWDMKKYGGWLRHQQLVASASSASAKFAKNTDDVTVTQMAVSDDNSVLVTVGEGGVMALWWNMTQRDLADRNIGTVLQKHTNSVTSIRFSPDSKHLVSGSADKSIILWDVSSGAVVAQMQTHARVADIDFLLGGRRIVARLTSVTSSRLGIWELIG